MTLTGRKIVIGLSGGIACYKIPYLVRALVKAGAEVKVVMTQNAMKFITPLTLETVSRNPVHCDMFAERDKSFIQHLELGHWADLIVIAPATANILAKLSHGICDDLLTTVMCATRKPVMVAPAMNPGMWDNPITRKNLQCLKDIGYHFVGPVEGEMAENQVGMGRMVEPPELFEAVKTFFAKTSKKKALTGRSVLVTAGPCREAIDPVRFISNRSSGKMGYAIARAALEMGAKTTLISGPTALTPPAGVTCVSIETTQQLLDAVSLRFADADCLIMAAAPSDFTPATTAKKKIKRGQKPLELELKPTVDILRKVTARKKVKQVVVGFALETDDEEANARRKLVDKRLDLIVVNNPRTKGAAFEHDTNRVSIITAKKPTERWPLMSKDEVARKLMERVAQMLTGRKR